MKAIILMLDIAGRVIGMEGPYNWTLEQCNANVELHVKMMAIPPFMAGIDPRVKTYQCHMIGKGRTRNI